jgi:Helix-turn-helix of DDE superfamily endonuclease
MVCWRVDVPCELEPSHTGWCSMLSYHTLQNKPRVLRAFTSLDPEEFETLLHPFEQAWEAYVTHHLRHKPARKRRYGGGRKPHLLAIEEKLLFILFDFKVYPLQEVMAVFFGMSQGGANEWIDKLSPLLESALGAAQALPERNPQNLEQVLALCVSVDFMIDGTERPVQRPTDALEQQDQYSGKKKAYAQEQSHR